MLRAAWIRLRPPKPRCSRDAQRMVRGHGLEIGGPTSLFRSWLPLYDVVGSLDNVNFRRNTIWEGTIVEGQTFRYHPARPAGTQYLLDATSLDAISSDRYDFLLASHILEHLANPIKALHEFSRVVVPGGAIVVIIPHKDGTFDHRRPVTAVAHMIADADNDVGEDDQTHLAEILACHDLERDPGAGSFEAFRARCLDNEAQRAVHHHTFTTQTAMELLQAAGLEVRIVEPVLGIHIILLATVPRTVAPSVTRPFVYPSPFPSDRPQLRTERMNPRVAW